MLATGPGQAQNRGMDMRQPTPLLGGLSPLRFMQRHWEKKPLLVRQACPAARPPATRAQLFELAAREDVESRMVARTDGNWKVRHGPFPRRSLPPVAQPGWTLLVQGLDLHLDAARALVEPFRFVPDARFDDLMLSWASDGGGVGPHVDAYDVFLLQVHGRRRWRIGPVADDACVDDLPLKILRHFEPEHDWVLEPGDLLYLPPLWGHDGIAVGECMTCSVGFRSPDATGLAAELLQRLVEDDERGRLYRDPRQTAAAEPAAMPALLAGFAREAVMRAVRQAGAIERALGECLTEPKPRVWFETEDQPALQAGVRLDRRSRMVYDDRHVFLNGESFRVSGRDAVLIRRLADARTLDAPSCARLSAGAREVVLDWVASGWLRMGAST